MKTHSWFAAATVAMASVALLAGCTEEDRSGSRPVRRPSGGPPAAATAPASRRPAKVESKPAPRPTSAPRPDEPAHAAAPAERQPQRPNPAQQRLIKAILDTIEQDIKLKAEPDTEGTRATRTRLFDQRMALYQELQHELEANR